MIDAFVFWNRNCAMGGSWTRTLPFSSVTCLTANISASVPTVSVASDRSVCAYTQHTECAGPSRPDGCPVLAGTLGHLTGQMSRAAGYHLAGPACLRGTERARSPHPAGGRPRSGQAGPARAAEPPSPV